MPKALKPHRSAPTKTPSVDIDKLTDGLANLPYAPALLAALKAADEHHRSNKHWAGAKSLRALTALHMLYKTLLTTDQTEAEQMQDLLWGIGSLADGMLAVGQSWSRQSRAQLYAIIAIIRCPVSQPDLAEGRESLLIHVGPSN